MKVWLLAGSYVIPPTGHHGRSRNGTLIDTHIMSLARANKSDTVTGLGRRSVDVEVDIYWRVVDGVGGVESVARGPNAISALTCFASLVVESLPRNREDVVAEARNYWWLLGFRMKCGVMVLWTDRDVGGCGYVWCG